MKDKYFCLRIDLESSKGIIEGLPKILNILKKMNIKASFYLSMGGESGLIDLLRYRRKLNGERKVKVFSFFEKVRMVLFPKDFVYENKQVLKRILEEGHELGIHGYKHRIWTRSNDNHKIEKEIEKAVKKYKQIFGKNPKSSAAPAFVINKEIIKALDKNNIKIISDLNGDKPFKIRNTEITNIPITITGKNNTPIIEYLASNGFSDDEIIDYIILKSKNEKFSSMYIHGLYEGVYKTKLLEGLIKKVKENFKIIMINKSSEITKK